MPSLKTEYRFTLPKGLVEDDQLHRDGTMRLATARDELEPLSDPKVKDPEDPYLTVIVLSRVITRLGERSRLHPKDIEGLFAADLAYLQDVYAAINYGTDQEIERALEGRRAPAPIRPAPPDAHRPRPTTMEEASAGGEYPAATTALESAPGSGRLGPLATVVATGPDEAYGEYAHDGVQDGVQDATQDAAQNATQDAAQDAAQDAEEEMELPTPRRSRIEEVGRSTGRPA